MQKKKLVVDKNKETDNNKKTIVDKKKEIFNKLNFTDNYIITVSLLTIFLFSVELIFRLISNFEIFNYATLRIFISTLIFAFIFSFISQLFKKRIVRNILNLVVIAGYSIYAWLQLGFMNYLGVYISFNTSSQFGAVTDYIYDYLLSFKFSYYLMFLPLIASILVYFICFRKKEYKNIVINLKTLWMIPILIVSILCYYGTITLSFMQNELQIKNNKELFVNPDVPTVAVNQFGTTLFGFLDLKSYLFPVEQDNDVFEAITPDENEKTEREVFEQLNVIAENETNSKYVSLNNYFASQTIREYNDYTGMFEGKNVVVILMESVNEAIINEEYFPNFTNLYNNGWSWINSYSPRNSCATGNNEFSSLTGLYSIYNSCTANVYKKNTYFQAIFNLFNEKGYTTTSMHNFSEWYYYRSTIHPNMGSGKYYGANDLKIKTAGYYGEWPSDVEFFDKAFDVVLNNESDAPWMTWLTTVTSHQPYSSSSTYGDLYKNDFKKLGYSTAVSRYLSKLKVLDNAIGVMVEKLKAANEWENTVIVMLADHYPYGLNKSAIKEMISHDLSDYEIEKTPFVIYNAGMEAKTFEDYTSYVNLVPTIANLLNLKHDPRLYMGGDLLSEDYESIVAFADGSWKNELAYYNASNSKIKYYTEFEYTPEEIQRINEMIELKISMSTKAIKNNYFKYLEEKLAEYDAQDEEINETKNTD